MLIDLGPRLAFSYDSTYSMQISFFHGGSALYGSERVLLSLVEAAVSAGHTARVYLPGEGPLVAKLAALPGASVSVFHFAGFPAGNPPCHQQDPLGYFRYVFKGFDFLKSTWWIWRELRRRRPDLVHSNSISLVSVALAAKALGLPHVWHVHDIIVRPKAGRILAYLTGLLADKVIAVSEAVKRHLVASASFVERRVTVIRNGIDPAAFGATGRGAFRRELGLGPQDILIGVIGRVAPIKGQHFFLEAIRRIPELPGLHFVMVGGVGPGDEALLERLREEARGQGRVHILDFREDIPAVYAALDVFVLPSVLPDALPTAILEAMATGLPVVATAQGGAPEMVVEGETGFLVAPGDATALADRIQLLARNEALRASMGGRGRERLAKQFALSRFVREFLACCESVLNSRQYSKVSRIHGAEPPVPAR